MLKAAPIVRRGSGRNLVVFDTPLDRYLLANNVRPAHLAAEANVGRQALRLYRAAVQEPTRAVMARIVLGLRTITGKRVRACDLWYLGEFEQDSWVERDRTTSPARAKYYPGREPTGQRGRPRKDATRVGKRAP